MKNQWELSTSKKLLMNLQFLNQIWTLRMFQVKQWRLFKTLNPQLLLILSKL